METISIKDENGKEYKFEKPITFGAKLLFVTDNNHIIGVRNGRHSIRWDINGECIQAIVCDRIVQEVDKYNLTPVKPKWYEDEKNFPVLFVDLEDNNMVTVCERKVHYDNVYFTERYRLATKEELLSLYYQDKEK